MNNIVFRFYLVKENKYFEVSFDSRLSFKDNFKLLQDIYPINIDTLNVYDKVNSVFLAIDVPISEFCFKRYTDLELLI